MADDAESKGAKRLKIIGITPTTARKGGGATMVNSNLWHYLGNKYEVMEVCSPRIGSTKYYFTAIRTFHSNKEKWKERFGKNLFVFNERAKAIEKRLDELQDNYDLIFQYGVLMAPYKQSKQKPFVVYIDYTMALAAKEYPDWAPLSKKALSKWIEDESRVYENADIVFTMSRHTAESVIGDYGIDASKVVSVGGGINDGLFGNLEKRQNPQHNEHILFVGTKFKRKGGQYLLEAFEKVKTVFPNAKLSIIGVTDQNIISTQKEVAVIGYLSQEELIEYFQSATLFVLPALCEPFGLAFIEAMAAGLPCIGTNRNAMPEIIEDGVNGYIVEACDSDDLASKIIKAFKDPDGLAQMGKASMEKAQKYFWPNIVDRMDYEIRKRNLL